MRAARRLLIALVVLFGLFVAADRVAVTVAESQVAGKLQTQRELAQKPGVDIEGFPFLTQLLGGSLDHVKVHANNMVLQGSGGSVTLTTFDADLRKVKLEDDYSTAVAGTATGTALISYADLSSVLPDHPSIAYASNGRVHVSATVDLPLLGSKQISGTAGLNAQGDSIGLASISDLVGLSGLPGVSSSMAASLASQYVGTPFRLTGLPEGLQVTRAQAEPDGLSVSVAGSGVSLSSSDN